MVEVSGGSGGAWRGWLELTGLARVLLRLREPKLLGKAFGTRNTRHIASALDKLRSAGLVREAVVGDVRYVYLTGRACSLLALLGYSLDEVACGEAALRLIRRAAGAASGTA
ncbi:hypothetical protein [Infirmifilum sp. SLHALR2]|nr:MAG: hypothetical protein B7L53_06890 [Thermofilum sp. NZ13]